MAVLDLAQCRSLITAARVGRLATVTGDGGPHVVPCCFVADGHRVYTAVDGKPKSTMALKRLDNISAQPRAALVVDHYDDDWRELWWVRIDGIAEVVSDDAERRAALHELATKYDQYRANPPEGALIRIAIEKWSGWAFEQPKGRIDP